MPDLYPNLHAKRHFEQISHNIAVNYLLNTLEFRRNSYGSLA